jgi:serine/threonine protein kinase
MIPERWQKLKEVCSLALEKEPAERAAFVADACGEDQELRREAESMIARATRGGGVLDGPIWKGFTPGTESAETNIAIPETIGSYRILRVIGEGGMGVVYEAQQDQPRRHVALKVIRPGLATTQMLRRFDRESQALARLHHIGIAQIYEAGTAETAHGAQPYFAMEFIQGLPLRQYADSHDLGNRARLELMSKICEAVEHAHRKGIIHRDLKPGNILVDESGQPKILDFGVARLTDSDAQMTKQTDMGQLVGTLAYMSPEQVLGDPTQLDSRSDVYALGVVLYELLAQCLPYKISDHLFDAVRTIRDEDPTRLSAINRTFRGDVETIVAKALEKDKTRRYASAAAMRGDIQNYLADEPITARPASTAYQLQKFAQRHKALVGATAIVFVVLIGGVIVSTREAVKAHRAEQVSQAVNDFLQNDLLAQASSSNQASASKNADPDLKVRTALDRAAARIGGKFDRQPEVEAAIRDTIGQTYMDLGLFPEATSQFQRAVELYRQALGVENEKTLRTVGRLANATMSQGKYPEAEALFSHNLEIERRVFGPDHSATLYSLHGLASVYDSEGKSPRAEALDHEILDIRRRLLGPENPSTLDSMNNLALVYYSEGKYGEAEALFAQIIELRRRRLGADHPDTLDAMNNLALVYGVEGKYMQAEVLDNQILEIRRRVVGAEHPDTLMSMGNLAVVYAMEGKYGQAAALDIEAVQIQRRLLGPEHPETLMYTGNLANFMFSQGKYADAEKLDNQVLEIRQRVLGVEHPDTLMSMNNLADDYVLRGRFAQAETLFSNAMEISNRTLGPENPRTLGIISDFASMYQRQGKYALAELRAGQALAGRRHALGSEHQDTLLSQADLALAYLSQKKFSESETLAREAVELNRKVQPDDWHRFWTESLLGASLAGQKKYADAETLLVQGYQGMAARQDRMGVPDWYHLDQAHKWLVPFYRAWGKSDKAAEWAKK